VDVRPGTSAGKWNTEQRGYLLHSHTMSSLIDWGPNCAELCKKTCRSLGAWSSPSCLSLLCMRSKAAASSCSRKAWVMSFRYGETGTAPCFSQAARLDGDSALTNGRYSAGDLCKQAPRSGSNSLTSCRSTLSLDLSLISASLQVLKPGQPYYHGCSAVAQEVCTCGLPILVNLTRLLPLGFSLKGSQKLMKLCLSSMLL